MHFDNKLEELRVEEIAQCMTVQKFGSHIVLLTLFSLYFFSSVQEEIGGAKKHNILRVITKT